MIDGLLCGLQAVVLTTSLHLAPATWLSEDAPEGQPQAPVEGSTTPNPDPPGPADGSPPAVVGPDDKPVAPGAATAEDDEKDGERAPSGRPDSNDVDDDKLLEPRPPPALPAKMCVKYLTKEIQTRLSAFSPGLGARGIYKSEWFIRLDEHGKVTGVVPVEAFSEEIFAEFMNEAFKKPFRTLCQGVYLTRVAWTPSGWWVQLPKGRR